MPDGVRIEGLRQLRRALRDIDKAAPRELNKTLKLAATREVLPAARAETPRGETGKLAASTSITTRGDRLLFRNTQPYANTIHWGRKQLRGAPNVVKGRPFLYKTLAEREPRIVQLLARELDRFISSRLK